MIFPKKNMSLRPIKLTLQTSKSCQNSMLAELAPHLEHKSYLKKQCLKYKDKWRHYPIKLQARHLVGSNSTQLAQQLQLFLRSHNNGIQMSIKSHLGRELLG